MLRFMHACMKKLSHPQMARVHPVGHLSVVQRNCTSLSLLCNAFALFHHCCATHLHCFITVVQRICTVLSLLCNAIARFYFCGATHLHCFIPVVQRNCTFFFVQRICTVLSLLCNAIALFYQGCATQLHGLWMGSSMLTFGLAWLIFQPAYGWVHPWVWSCVFISLSLQHFLFQSPPNSHLFYKCCKLGVLGILGVSGCHTLNLNEKF